MSITDTQRKIDAVLNAFETVGSFAKSLLPEGAAGRAEQAVNIVKVVELIFNAVISGLAGDNPIGDTETQLAKFRAALEADDAAAKALEDALFPQG